MRTRFAPSPTGHLHIGGARTAIFAWLHAKAQNGKFLIRFEDTDKERSKQEYVDSILSSLSWLGIEADEEPLFQSNRQAKHKEIALDLLNKGLAYSCNVSPERLEEIRKIQQQNKQQPRYDGFSRDLNLPHEKGNVIRFKMPLAGETSFEDKILKKISINNKELDDFIIIRSDGSPTYNFCAAVDDIEMEITTVIRGDDHITNTLKQINILKALETDIPEYAHLPMVLSSDGKRLSKRDGALDINEYKKMGYLKEAMLNYLIKLGWTYKEQEIFSEEELIKYFDIQNVNSSAAKFSQKLLDFYNNHYLKETDINSLYAYIEKNFSLSDKFNQNPKKIEIIDLLRESSNNIIQIIDELTFFHKDPKLTEELLTSIQIDKDLLEKFKVELEEVDFNDKLLIGVFLDNFLSKNNLKFPILGKPLRLILTGKSKAPSITDLIFLLGKENCLERIEKFLKI
ncbi:MAG: glutamate--tRNA ligase [Gammaproteobacteria bacterium]|nr:MAG: glutamate--tRNA ligase [Gammaproteobacteria bacterium]|tara:strand:- start:3304 stop:4671 length:1368 start_codon:yes stop_codon:yes gene_type:complete